MNRNDLRRPWTMTLEEWLRLDHTVQENGSDMQYIDSAGNKTLWPGTHSRETVIRRQHEYAVTLAVGEGRAVPSLVLADYPHLASTHHRHPYTPGETLCSRLITDAISVGPEVTCYECLLFARRGYDMYGEALP